MRLHTLSVTAFGPFAEATTVDFDALSEASVFLLCGDTGAGKSTVLDAVCFALYGDLPSDRARAKQLRSHFAADGVAPRVVLETTLGGRRLRFTRSPAWQRPKRRGSGTTTEQAHVLVEELLGDGWTVRASRLDEAGHLVDAVLGMTKEQFSQVVLLPQGQFDTFLAAASEDRQRVLTQLFRTRRFEDVERWLVERRTTLRRESEEHRRRVGALLHRLAEAAGSDLPDDLDGGLDAGPDAGPAATTGADRASEWAAALEQSADLALSCADDDDTDARLRRGEAERAVEVGAEQLRLRAPHDRARQTLDALAASLDQATDDRARLAGARRAATVAPLAAPAARAEHDATAARTAAVTALAALSGSGPATTDGRASRSDDDDNPTADDLDLLAAEARDRASRIGALLPGAEELARLTRDSAALQRRLEQTFHELDEVERALADQPSAVERTEQQVAALRATAGALDAAESRIAELRRRSRDRQELVVAGADLAAAQEHREHLRQARQDGRDALYAVQERRLLSMAAELATDLAVGAECPVCGSGEHPSPARRSPGSVGADDVRAAQRALDAAEVDLGAADEGVRVVEARVAALTDRLGATTTDDDATALSTADAALVAAREADAGLPAAEDELAGAVDLLARLRSRSATLTTTARHLREERDATADRADRLAEDLRALLDGADAPSEDVTGAPTAAALRAVAERHDALARVLTDAREALRHRERTRVAAELAATELAASAADAGFSSVAEALGAVLPADTCDALDAALRHRETRESEAREVLADPEVLGAAEGPAADLTALREALAEATTTATEAATRRARAQERCQALSRGRTDLDAALAAWAPVRHDLDVARSLAELAEGKGTDNTRQMRLSAYVLAARLGQVVAAANERLARMSDDRYLLEHVADRAVGDRRGGLSLLVRDQWTDETRDPVTLSGGETFVVSLALALGLADVVTGEAGGARIDTLFVDEGFGSLDPDTLELVMDTLDDLREGGRVVGVVSHVPELRTRIGTQLVVRKGRHGSALELRRGAA